MLHAKYLEMLTELKKFICTQEATIINHSDMIDDLHDMLKEKDEIIKNLEAQVEELQYELNDRKGL